MEPNVHIPRELLVDLHLLPDALDELVRSVPEHAQDLARLARVAPQEVCVRLECCA